MTEGPKTSTAVNRWKTLGEPQEITLPSGTAVKIQVPDVAEMLRNGDVPNELIRYANEAQDDTAVGGVDMEKVKEATDYIALGPQIEGLLFETSARDPLAYAVAIGAVLVMTLAATVLPGVRASRVDPLVALRAD